MDRSGPDARTRALQEASTRLVTATRVEPSDDIIAERARATFDVNDLLYFVNGSKENVERRAALAAQLAKIPWADKSRRHFLSREEEYVGALRAALGIWEKMRAEKLSIEDGMLMRQLVDFPGGLELHIGMFIPTLLSQASAEQQSHWLPQSFNLKIIGTYAQTELGHGTFVRGLETTATYDPERQEFILHSPTLTSTKWWPGGMGKTSTHAVVMARLIVGGTDHGPHAFIVQLRSLADHKPMPGVTVGDIGPKFGYGGVDNGYMSMDYVRVPRSHMLMRFAQVTPEGRYVPPPPANAKASYATMLFVRADIVKNASAYLSKAVTIATRYAAVRRQTAVKAGEKEWQVLDYQNVAHSLLPLVAASYGLWFMGERLMALYTAFEKARDAGDFSVLPELHALSSGQKALCTAITADGIEACRRSCGGHGYSKLSGLPSLYQNYVQNVTWEGDNDVLYLQTGRWLVKAAEAAAGGKRPSGGAAYLGVLAGGPAGLAGRRCGAAGPDCWRRPEVQREALAHRALRLVGVAAANLRAASGNGRLVTEGPAWNRCTVDVIAAARAHCQLALHEAFVEGIEGGLASGKLQPATAGVLRQLCSLWALGVLEAGAGDLLADGYLSGEQGGAVRSAARSLLSALRPNAVALVDAWGLEDYALNSALGRHDGDVYRALLDMAQASPLNASAEGPAWEGVLKPAMLRPQSKL